MLKRIITLAGTLGLCLSLATPAQAGPKEDLARFQHFYLKRFPGVPLKEFANGVYAIDKVSRENWEAIEEFPPYEPYVEEGKEMWNTPFKDGKGYKDCFPDGPAIKADYPRWDAASKRVLTLELAINECRQAHGEKPLKYKKGPIAILTAYIAWESRGKPTHVVIPDDPDARAAYERGKRFWLARRGQLNFSCATCHAQNAGKHIRADILSPALGHTTHFPVYRSKWGELGTLHRRFTGCNKQVRAKPFKPQSEQYRDLEYFLTYMSNGIPLNGPGARK